MHDPPPLGFGSLEIDEEADGSPRGSQVVETLRGVFMGEALHAFQFDNEHVFDQDIGIVFSNIMTLIADGKRRLRGGPDATKPEFSQQGTLVDLFPESGAQEVGNLDYGAYYALGGRIRASGSLVFIGG